MAYIPSTTLIESGKLHPNITVRPKRSNQNQPPSLGAQDEDEDLCSICLDPVRMKEAKTSTCKSGCHHMVHSQCWRMYLMKIPAGKRSCPMCRNKDTHWPDDELSRIAFLYADPVVDIIEKGPTWWLGLTQQYVNLHYFQEDETQEEFTSRMEESLQEALEQGATDPEPDSDDEVMPSLISDEDYQMGEVIVVVPEEYTVLEPLTDEEGEQQDEDQVLENDASLAHAREAAQRLEEEFYQDQRRRHQEIAEDLAADMAGFDRWGPPVAARSEWMALARLNETAATGEVREALETEFRNSLERQLLQEFDLENDDDASIGATHPDDMITDDA